MGNYNALRIALYVIKRYMARAAEISNLKLHTVLSFIQKGFLYIRKSLLQR